MTLEQQSKRWARFLFGSQLWTLWVIQNRSGGGLQAVWRWSCLFRPKKILQGTARENFTGGVVHTISLPKKSSGSLQIQKNMTLLRKPNGCYSNLEAQMGLAQRSWLAKPFMDPFWTLNPSTRVLTQVVYSRSATEHPLEDGAKWVEETGGSLALCGAVRVLLAAWMRCGADLPLQRGAQNKG